ncbi:ergothioneine biosynthesis protein EgtB [Myxosarcina sp. GI1]|uniref:ergothioneine biosynthesis protein EgtB n=1 Tax=Myxosarcina sp. GI1 TaxID=1541065 RepID=UPI0005629028|nr:ergothioneine biosynthesis protein EgtB [Myxosarcina sp. GI1]
MKSKSVQLRKRAISRDLARCRQKTLDLIVQTNSEAFTSQAHPDFSPIGWHFGHIAFTEAYWILEYLGNCSPLFPEYRVLFAADGLPKAQRQNLPSIKTIRDYLSIVRTKILDYLETSSLDSQERLWQWLIQHESQHNETMAFLLQLYRRNQNLVSQVNFARSSTAGTESSFNLTEMVSIPAGEFCMGSNAIEAQDNERPAHKVYLNSYWLDRYPVTCRQYREFIISGGYQNRCYWSETGWQWLQNNPVCQPLYWSDAVEWDNHPVCGVSYYEAEAYANFVGKRLPTEAEWEKAACGITTVPATSLKCNHNSLIGHTTPVNAYPEGQSSCGCYDMLGNVWEWTSSWFAGYCGFSSYPYFGYSRAYFDNQHRVLRGGSWATSPWTLRTSFRNWYHPWVRQILVGFRCARD